MLRLLNRKQLKGFRDYLTCNLFNTSTAIVKLFDQFESQVLRSSKEFVGIDQLLEGTGIGPATVKKLFSQLRGHLNRYLSLLESRENSKAEFAGTLRMWGKLGLEPEQLELEYRKMKRRFGSETASVTELYQKLQMEHSYSHFLIGQPRGRQAGMFEDHIQLLETYYGVSKLKYLCARLNIRRILREEEEELELGIGPGQLGALPPLGRAYHLVFQCFQKGLPEEHLVIELIEILSGVGSGFSSEDQTDLLGYTLNLCFRRLSLGAKAFEPLVKQIYDIFLERGLLVEGGEFSAAHFKNIVSFQVRTGAFDEASTFIQDNSNYLAEEQRAVVVNYSLGLVSFYKNDFQEAIIQFRSIVRDAPEDVFLKLEARNMLWRSYFEAYESLDLDEVEEMFRLYHAFRVFVSRNQNISEYHKLSYQNFIRIFNRLIHDSDQRLSDASLLELESLRDEASELEKITHKDWLIGAINRKINRLQK